MARKYFYITKLFFLFSLSAMPVFAQCNLDSHLTCWRGGFLGSGKPCTLLVTKFQANYVIIGGISTITNPAPFPGSNPTDTMVDEWPGTWEGGIAKFYPGRSNVRFESVGTFGCYAGQEKHHLKKIDCNKVIQYNTSYGQSNGNC